MTLEELSAKMDQVQKNIDALNARMNKRDELVHLMADMERAMDMKDQLIANIKAEAVAMLSRDDPPAYVIRHALVRIIEICKRNK